MGFDVMHINLHKTFSTPHGGGGPGAGPVGVRAGLEQFLPNPRVVKHSGDDDPLFHLDFGTEKAPHALGRISSWLGNFAVELRALAYILSLGSDGLKLAGTLATLNANCVKNHCATFMHCRLTVCANMSLCSTDLPINRPGSPL